MIKKEKNEISNLQVNERRQPQVRKILIHISGIN